MMGLISYHQLKCGRGFSLGEKRTSHAKLPFLIRALFNVLRSLYSLDSRLFQKHAQTCHVILPLNGAHIGPSHDGFDLISPTKMRPRFSWGGKSALHTPNFPVNSRPFQCSSIDLLFGFAPFSMLGRCSVVDSLCGFAPITVPEH